MTQAEAEFIEKVGVQLEAEGAPRISGKMVACLVLSEEALSLDELAEELKVSKASVSVNARLLEEWGIIERLSRMGNRRDYYRIAEDVEVRMLSRRLDRMRRMVTLLQEGERLAPKTGVVRQRVERLTRFHEHALHALQQAVEQISSCQSYADLEDELAN